MSDMAKGLVLRDGRGDDDGINLHVLCNVILQSVLAPSGKEVLFLDRPDTVAQDFQNSLLMNAQLKVTIPLEVRS